MELRCGIPRRQHAGDVRGQVDQPQRQQRLLVPGRLEQLPGHLERGVARLRRRRAPAVGAREELAHPLRSLAALALDRRHPAVEPRLALELPQQPADCGVGLRIRPGNKLVSFLGREPAPAGHAARDVNQQRPLPGAKAGQGDRVQVALRGPPLRHRGPSVSPRSNSMV